jgi:hypothetical protein
MKQFGLKTENKKKKSQKKEKVKKKKSQKKKAPNSLIEYHNRCNWV